MSRPAARLAAVASPPAISPGADALPHLLRAGDVCRQLGVSRSWLYELHASGRLPGYRLGAGRGGLRFDVDELRGFVHSCREGGR